MRFSFPERPDSPTVRDDEINCWLIHGGAAPLRYVFTQSGVAVDRCARKIAGILTLHPKRVRRLNANPLGRHLPVVMPNHTFAHRCATIVNRLLDFRPSLADSLPVGVAA